MSAQLLTQVIDMVLATDMKQHFSLLSHFNTVHRLANFTKPAPSTPGGGTPYNRMQRCVHTGPQVLKLSKCFSSPGHRGAADWTSLRRTVC